MMPSAIQDNQPSCDKPLIKPVAVRLTNTNVPRDATSQPSEHKLVAVYPLPQEANRMNRDSSLFSDSQLASTNFQPERDTMSDSGDLGLCYPEHPIISTPRDIMNDQARNDDGNFAARCYNSTDHFVSSENMLPLTMQQRARREFVPDDRKDDRYWDKRLKNNDSARRSRFKRKIIESNMQKRLLDLQIQNLELKHELEALRRRYAGDEMYKSGAAPTKDTINISTLPPSIPKTTKTNSVRRVSVSDDPLLSDFHCSVVSKPIPSLDHGFSTEIADYIKNTSYSKDNIKHSAVKRTESGDSFISNCDSEILKTDALDLSRYTPTCESLSSDGESYGSSQRRCSYRTSECSSQEDNTSAAQTRVVPSKCPWKKRLLSRQTHLPE